MKYHWNCIVTNWIINWIISRCAGKTWTLPQLFCSASLWRNWSKASSTIRVLKSLISLVSAPPKRCKMVRSKQSLLYCNAWWFYLSQVDLFSIQNNSIAHYIYVKVDHVWLGLSFGGSKFACFLNLPDLLRKKTSFY